MYGSRRFLPSMSSLLALEAVGRLGGASAAAREMSLTHGAISRQLKVLEEQFGSRLVIRDGGRLRLTPAGEEYCGVVRRALNDLSRASLALKANPSGGSLNLSVLPAFAMHWLAPRLKGFAGKYPEVTLNLSTRLVPFDFAREDFDAAIHFGNRDWPNVHYLRIAGEEVVPVCAPGMLKETEIEPADLLEYPLLHLETRPYAWERWFEEFGVPAKSLPGMLFDQFSTMAQAAAHRLGIALLPTHLAEIEIGRGGLVRASATSKASLGSYFLVWPEGGRERPPLVSFRQWLETVATA